MPKIKDNINLKQLKNYGFDDLVTCYCKDTDDKNWILRVDTYTREIKCWNIKSGEEKDVEPYVEDLKEFIEGENI